MENKYGGILFYLFIYLNTFCKGIGLSNSSKAYMILLILGTIFLFIKIIGDKYTKKELMACFIILGIGFLTFIVTHKVTLFLTCITLCGMKNIDLKKLLKNILLIRIISFIGITGLSLLKIIPNKRILMWRNGSFDIRYSLGFGHPNILQLSLFIIIALFLYLKGKKINFFQYMLLIFVSYFIYFYSQSRTGFVCTLGLISIHFFFNKIVKKPNSKRLCNVSLIILVFLMAFSYATGVLYGSNSIITKLDYFFNGRIRYSNYYLTTYGFSLFGNGKVLTDSNAILDNGYILMFIQYGAIGTILVFGFLSRIIKSDFFKNDYNLFIISIFMFIYLFNESFTPNIFMNFILLFYSKVLFKNNVYVLQGGHCEG